MSEEKAQIKKHYITRKESRQIAKENSKAIRHFEKLKKRKSKPEDYTTEMKDDKNIVEFEDLQGGKRSNIFRAGRFDGRRGRRKRLRQKRHFALAYAACSGAQRSDCKRLDKV